MQETVIENGNLNRGGGEKQSGIYMDCSGNVAWYGGVCFDTGYRCILVYVLLP